jgi:hypothetical protein
MNMRKLATGIEIMNKNCSASSLLQIVAREYIIYFPVEIGENKQSVCVIPEDSEDGKKLMELGFFPSVKDDCWCCYTW